MSPLDFSKDCLVVYASCGEGHKKAGLALADYFKISCLDLLDFSCPYIKILYSRGYRFVTKNLPLLWLVLFEVTKLKIIRVMFSQVHLFFFLAFIEFIRKNRPKIIITTHFFPIPLILKVKHQLNLKLVTIVTDFGIHPLWIDKNVDFYLVAFEITKKGLIAKGIEEKNIEVTGFPLRRGFRETLDKDYLRRKFSLDSRPGILLFSSTQGDIPFLEDIVKGLKRDFNIFIIYGDNKKIRAFLNKVKDHSVRYFSYYEKIWELMDISLAVITKPGGLTVFETLYKRKPLIFTHFIWGQEKINLDIVLKLGLGFLTPSFEELKKLIYSLRDNKVLYKNHNWEDKDIFFTVENTIRGL